MITDFLLDNPVLVRVTLLAVVLACVAAGYLLLRVRRYGQRVLWVLTTLSLVPIVVLTLVPVSNQGAQLTCTVQFALPTLHRLELLTNVALFVPLVFFAALSTRRPLPVLAAGVLLSAVIETVQAVVPAIGRACDTNDWAMNSIGTVLAVILAAATIRVAERTAARPQ